MCFVEMATYQPQKYILQLGVSIWCKSNFVFKVEFSINEVKRTGQQSAVTIKILNRTVNTKRLLGYIATLKDNFGFIETANHDQEIFFHYRYNYSTHAS